MTDEERAERRELIAMLKDMETTAASLCESHPEICAVCTSEAQVFTFAAEDDSTDVVEVVDELIDQWLAENPKASRELAKETVLARLRRKWPDLYNRYWKQMREKQTPTPSNPEKEISMSNVAKLYRRVQAMSDSQLDKFAEEHQVDMSLEFDDAKHARNHVCEQLNLSDDDDGDADEMDPFGGQLSNIADQLMKEFPDRFTTFSQALAGARKRYPDLDKNWQRSMPSGVSAGRQRV